MDEGGPTTGQPPALSPGESALRAGPGVAGWAATVRVQRSNLGREAGRRRSRREEGGRERKQQREGGRDAPGNW